MEDNARRTLRMRIKRYMKGITNEQDTQRERERDHSLQWHCLHLLLPCRGQRVRHRFAGRNLTRIFLLIDHLGQATASHLLLTAVPLKQYAVCNRVCSGIHYGRSSPPRTAVIVQITKYRFFILILFFILNR